MQSKCWQRLSLKHFYYFHLSHGTIFASVYYRIYARKSEFLRIVFFLCISCVTINLHYKIIFFLKFIRALITNTNKKMQLQYMSILAKITTSRWPMRSNPIFMELQKIKQSCTLVCYIMVLQKEVTSFCSISFGNKHDPSVIWAFLIPIMMMIKQAELNIGIIYFFFSNGLSTLCRQKNNFYLFNHKIFKYGFKQDTWSFF